MSDEQYALSPTPSSPPPPTEADYEAIFAAVMETVRGRWFLSEFARRNRHTDTQMVLAAIDRLQATMHGERADPAFERIRTDIRDMADAIAATRREIAAIRPDGEHTGIGEATEELDSIIMATERATSEILAAAETIQEMAWTLREQGLDAKICDKLDACATEVYLACSFQDLTGQRTRKVIHVLRFLEQRINSMVEILGGETAAPPSRSAAEHAPLDLDMDQAQIDAVMPARAATQAAEPISAAETAQPGPATEAVETDARLDVEGASDEAMALAMPDPASGMAADSAAADTPDAVHVAVEEPGMPAPDDMAGDDGTVSRLAEPPTNPPEEALSPPAETDEDHGGSMAIAGSGDTPAVDTSEMSLADETDEPGEAEALIAEAEADTAEAAPGQSHGAAPNTRALLADLLAIIRPASDGDIDEAIDRYDDSPADAAAEFTPSEPLDLRRIQPVTPPSDFVIVTLAPENAAADEATDETSTNAPPAVETTSAETTETIPTEATDAAEFEESAEEAPTDRLPEIVPPADRLDGPAPSASSEPMAREDAVEETPASFLPEVAPAMDGLVETAASEPAASWEARADTSTSLLPEIRPSIEGAEDSATPEPAVFEAAVEAVPTSVLTEAESRSDAGDVAALSETSLFEIAPEPMAWPATASAAEPDQDDSAIAAAETVGVVGLDDDLLMAPIAAPPPAEPTADAIAHLDLDLDLLLPAETTSDTRRLAGETNAVETATSGAPNAIDAEVASEQAMPVASMIERMDDGVVGDEAIESAAPAETADDLSPLASEQDEDAPPHTFARALLDADAGHEGSDGAQATAADPALPPMGRPLDAGATAALAVLAIPVNTAVTTRGTTAVAAATGSMEPSRETTAGHIDPLAAVKALSVEERIALFS
jgi:chemotaxis regulatin CheY-phosphate phosphatase CheZ